MLTLHDLRCYFDNLTKMVIRLDIGVVPAFKLQKRQGMSPPLHGEPGDTSKERRHPILALSYQQQVLFVTLNRRSIFNELDPVLLEVQVSFLSAL